VDDPHHHFPGKLHIPKELKELSVIFLLINGREKPAALEILIYYVIASFVREAWRVTGFRI
jgi:hypothetical protein